jgi:putative ABC transport system ATP-binding protein
MSVTNSWLAARRRVPEPEAPGAGGGADVVVRQVVKSYGRIRALRGVSLEVGASEFVTITGPSGSGKSTLLNLIGSLDRPDEGEIMVAGLPVPEPAHAVEFRRHIVGFVFQDNPLLPYMSAERTAELLDEVGLNDRARHLPSELSGGQRQAVALARAIAGRPRLLLADEPTGALDSASGKRALDLLSELRRRHGMTVLIVSHDPAVAERANRVVRLVDGEVAGD